MVWVVAPFYFLASLFGILFVVKPEQLSVFWPAGGLLLGLLFTLDRRRWVPAAVAAFTGNAAANLVVGHAVAVSLGFAVVNAIEPVILAWLLVRVRGGAYRLETLQDVLLLHGIPLLVCAGTALLGAGVVTAGLGAPSYWGVWKVWWLADAVGATLFAPLVFTHARPPHPPAARRRERTLEIAAMTVALALVTAGIFASDLRARSPLFALPYPVFPLILGIALRGRLSNTAVAVAVVGSISAWGTVNGYGPIGGKEVSVADRVLVVQGFAAVVGLMSLTLATSLQERRRREDEVVALNQTLSAQIALGERTRHELEASEQRFRAIFHAQFQFIGLMAPDGTLLEANRTALAAAGVPVDEALGRPFWETVWWAHDAAQQARLRAAVERAAAGEQARFEATHPAADGRVMWVDFSLTPFRDASGRVTLLIPEGRDITAQKAVEARLRASEEFSRLVVEGVKDYAIFMLDPEGRVVSWNVGAERLKGYTAQEAVGLHFSRFYPPGVVEEGWPDQELATAREVGRFEDEGWRVRKDGSRFWANVVMTAVHDEAGRLRGFSKITRDVTARREAERTLAASEALLRQFVAYAPAAIAMLDADMRYLQVSERWVADYHLPVRPAEIVGRSHYEVFPDISARWKAIHRRVLGGAIEACAEDPFPRADGTTEWLQWEARPWRNASGGVGGLIFFTQVITARKRAEAELRESQERFRGAFDFAPIGVALVAPDGRWLKVNRALCQLLGYAEGELLATDFQSLTHPDDLAADLGLAARVLAGEMPSYQMGKRYFHKSGRLIHAVLAVSLVRGAAGAPLYFIAQVEDVTDREQAKQELIAANHRLRLLLESSGEGIYGIDETGVCTFANRASVEALGRPLEEIIGQNMHALCHHTRAKGAEYPAADCPIFQVLRTGVGCEVGDEVFWRKDGTAFPVEYSSYPLVENGAILGAVVLFRDVTARRAAENNLRASEERYRSVVEALAEGIVLQGADGSIQAINRRAEQILGLTHDQLTSDPATRPAWRVVREGGEPFPADDYPARVALRTGRPVFNVLMGMDRPTGDRTWLSVNAVPFEDASGAAPKAVVASFHDVTEARRLNDRLINSVREKEVMLREIHHRVKNNLAVISSLFHLQAGAVKDGPTVVALREAQDRVRSMALVHEHLYNAADLGAVAFGEYAAALASQIFQTYKLPTAKVEFRSAAGPVRLTIEQAIPCGLILNELLTNCLKHAFVGRDGGTVRLALGALDGSCVLQVSDDGVGVPPDLDVRTARSLGVRLVRILTSQLDGTVRYSPTNPGTEVRLVFPLPAG